MQRRVPPSERHLFGARLVGSVDGGFSVLMGEGNDYLGYLHASSGQMWRAYQRKINQMDWFLGWFGQDEAVRRIILASGRVPREAAA